MTEQAYNFACLDEQTKRMIRRAIRSAPTNCPYCKTPQPSPTAATARHAHHEVLLCRARARAPLRLGGELGTIRAPRPCTPPRPRQLAAAAAA